MPYKRSQELPDRVKNNLPKHAQDIYRKAFNNAQKQYQEPEKRRGQESADQAAHRVAWAAVKKEYQKDGQGNWKRKSQSRTAKSSRSSSSRARSGGARSTRSRSSGARAGRSRSSARSSRRASSRR